MVGRVLPDPTKNSAKLTPTVTATLNDRARLRERAGHREHPFGSA